MVKSFLSKTLFILSISQMLAPIGYTQIADQGQYAPPPPPEAQMQEQEPAAPPLPNIPPPPPPQAVTNNGYPPGQWVVTAQYGNVYMPYNQVYVHAPLLVGEDPHMYIYSPIYGWRWMPAPWIFGIGPRPSFGTYGYARFGWFGRPWFGHPWFGFARGYPSGYHGIVFRHPGPYDGGRGYAGPRYHGPAFHQGAPLRSAPRRRERREER